MRFSKLAGTILAAMALTSCQPFQVNPGNTRVAVILPLSGPLGKVGEEMRNSIALASMDRPSNVEIKYFDSLGTAEGAFAAGQGAQSFGAGLVLGPLVGANISEVRRGLNTGASIISFSNDATKASPNNFIFNLTPADSINRVLEFSAANENLSIGMLYPSNDLGRASAAAAAQIAPTLGIDLVAAFPYDVDAGRDGATSRQEAAQKMAELSDLIDGLLLPDRGPRLREIATLAFFYELEPPEENLEDSSDLDQEPQATESNEEPRNKITYLGTHLMDDASLANEPALSGAYFAGINDRLEQFEQRYSNNFSSSPQIHSVAAYDAMSMAISLVSNGKGLGYQSLTNRSGFVGVLGTYRLLGNGQVERLLGIKTIGKDGIELVDLPARSFEY